MCVHRDHHALIQTHTLKLQIQVGGTLLLFYFTYDFLIVFNVNCKLFSDVLYLMIYIQFDPVNIC